MLVTCNASLDNDNTSIHSTLSDLFTLLETLLVRFKIKTYIDIFSPAAAAAEKCDNSFSQKHDENKSRMQRTFLTFLGFFRMYLIDPTLTINDTCAPGFPRPSAEEIPRCVESCCTGGRPNAAGRSTWLGLERPAIAAGTPTPVVPDIKRTWNQGCTLPTIFITTHGAYHLPSSDSFQLYLYLVS